jgi:uncharacterized metal-binding protein
MPTEKAVLSRAEETYLSQVELRELALAAARTEAAGYCKEPRVEEIMNFARRIGARRLGIASCIGLIREARILQEILEANGFEVDSRGIAGRSRSFIEVRAGPQSNAKPRRSK